MPRSGIIGRERLHHDHRGVGGADFGLVIEFADTSLLLDRREKGRLYAVAGIPEYWLINLIDRHNEVYAQPDLMAVPAVYRSPTDSTVGQSVPLVLDGQLAASLSVQDLLP